MFPTVTRINGRKILWTDDFGVTHSCRRAEVVADTFLVWTGPIASKMYRPIEPTLRNPANRLRGAPAFLQARAVDRDFVSESYTIADRT